MTPTQRTLALLRERGYKVGIVARFNRFSGQHGQRQDLFGFIDIIAMDGVSIIGVQSCGTAFAAHHRKMTETEDIAEAMKRWYLSGGEIMLIGWRKVLKKRGGKQKIYKPRIRWYAVNSSDQLYWTDEK